jgi:hypothetical protein
VRELKPSGWVKSIQPFYSSCDIIEVSKSRMSRWAGHAVQAGEIRNVFMFVCSRNGYQWVIAIEMYLGLGL